jgi:nitroreductase
VEFSEVIKRRRMVRAFTTEAVSPAFTERLLRAANRAPSAGFSQGYSFLVLEGPDETARLWSIFAEEPMPTFDPVRNAPLLVVPLANRELYLDRYAEPDKGWTDRDAARWPVPYWYIDTGFTALLMLLTAVDEGLGAVFFGIPPGNIPAFRETFGVPADWTPIGAVAVGHPDPAADAGGSAQTRARKPLAEIVHRATW